MSFSQRHGIVQRAVLQFRGFHDGFLSPLSNASRPSKLVCIHVLMQIVDRYAVYAEARDGNQRPAAHCTPSNQTIAAFILASCASYSAMISARVLPLWPCCCSICSGVQL